MVPTGLATGFDAGFVDLTGSVIGALPTGTSVAGTGSPCAFPSPSQSKLYGR